ncbi:MAG TPA: phosphoheptose isomerase [Solimonas sp.]|nr:phosphoheptose isomerase [Solimonas sp.]
MSIEQRIRGHFEASVRTHQDTLSASLAAIVRASQRLVECLKAGNKVLVCGNGGSAADAQHFAAELTGRYERERPGLPGIALTTDTSALTAIANDYSYEVVFSKQVQALGRAGDVLIAISTSGNSGNVLKAMEAAHALGLGVIAMTGKDGGRMAKALKGADVELRSASQVTARIQETHILMLHCLCDAIDEAMFFRQNL